MRIVIFGTGGAGGYFGAQLARAGEDVIFIARGEHLSAIRTHGLCIEAPAGEIVIWPALATDNPSEIAHADVVLVGVKAWQVTEAAAAIRTMMGPQTFVVPLQNGVDAPSQLAAVLGTEHVLGGLCGTLSWVTAPGRIRSVGAGNFIKFAELDNRPSDRTEQLRRAFEQAGVKVEVPSDIHKALWDKFLFVTSFGGVGAVTRVPIGVVRTVPETRRLLEQCMQEVLALARARRVALANTVVADTMALVDLGRERDHVAATRYYRRKAIRTGIMERGGGTAGAGRGRRNSSTRVYLSLFASTGTGRAGQSDISALKRFRRPAVEIYPTMSGSGSTSTVSGFLRHGCFTPVNSTDQRNTF